MVGVHCFQQSDQQSFWCGALADCGTVWRHGCRHRASTDGFTACPASGEGAAPSTDPAFDLASDCIQQDAANETTALLVSEPRYVLLAALI